jgi:hypothetical protein
MNEKEVLLNTLKEKGIILSNVSSEDISLKSSDGELTKDHFLDIYSFHLDWAKWICDFDRPHEFDNLGIRQQAAKDLEKKIPAIENFVENLKNYQSVFVKMFSIKDSEREITIFTGESPAEILGIFNY